LAEVIKAQQIVHTLEDVDGSLIGFSFPVAASSVNVPAGTSTFCLPMGRARPDRGRGRGRA
jgi:hypothetical protein